MNRILEEIIENKRVEVEKRKSRLSVTELQRMMGQVAPVRDFAAAVSAPGRLNVIGEIKKASPSAGIIRYDFDPARLAAEIESAGACAISVLTEEKFFYGDIFHLVNARESVGIPVLRKDFIIDEYQVYESRAYNADALLLIVRVLGGALSRMLALCAEIGMQALVEVHDTQEARLAVEAGAPLIGINNRNLDDFTVDVSNTFRIIKEIPPHRTVVSESGIRTGEDCVKLKEAGVNAVLVGESLMRSGSITEKMKEFLV
jgi:indole-3-glycerol phosphate synthase